MGFSYLRNLGELFYRKNAVLLLVCNNVADQLLANDLLVVGEPVNQGRIA